MSNDVTKQTIIPALTTIGIGQPIRQNCTDLVRQGYHKPALPPVPVEPRRPSRRPLAIHSQPPVQHQHLTQITYNITINNYTVTRTPPAYNYRPTPPCSPGRHPITGVLDMQYDEHEHNCIAGDLYNPE